MHDFIDGAVSYVIQDDDLIFPLQYHVMGVRGFLSLSIGHGCFRLSVSN